MTELKKKISDKELDTVVNYLVISFGYGSTICLPYADGISVLKYLEKAEATERYYENQGLVLSKQDMDIQIHTISQKKYREAKMNMLLGVENEATG